MFHGRDQKRADPSALLVRLCRPIAFQQPGKELLRQILRVITPRRLELCTQSREI
jgi:hypothetical protein